MPTRKKHHSASEQQHSETNHVRKLGPNNSRTKREPKYELRSHSSDSSNLDGRIRYTRSQTGQHGREGTSCASAVSSCSAKRSDSQCLSVIIIMSKSTRSLNNMAETAGKHGEKSRQKIAMRLDHLRQRMARYLIE